MNSIIINLYCFCRGAYDNNTEPGTRPYEDGLELTVSYIDSRNAVVTH